MRIAQIAPPFESVPPRLYGGTERVVSYLTEELVALGHEVTLFASGDSVTSARLVSWGAEALRLASRPANALAAQLRLTRQVAREADQFDIIHNHLDYGPFPVLRGRAGASLTTPHGRLDGAAWRVMTQRYPDLPLSSISFAQRRALPGASWLGTVYHGIPAQQHRPRERHGDYLAFIGRISPEKRVDRAVDIARRSGMPLKIAAKLAPTDRAYIERVLPLLDDPLVDFLGEVGDAERDELLGNAYALLFPIDWPEPFGLVVLEAMACGTPVIGFRHGAVPELVQEGVTGFVVDDVAGAVAAVERVVELDRRRCRDVFDNCFTARRMASQYVELYGELLAARASTSVGVRLASSMSAALASPASMTDNRSGERSTAPA